MGVAVQLKEKEEPLPHQDLAQQRRPPDLSIVSNEMATHGTGPKAALSSWRMDPFVLIGALAFGALLSFITS